MTTCRPAADLPLGKPAPGGRLRQVPEDPEVLRSSAKKGCNTEQHLNCIYREGVGNLPNLPNLPQPPARRGFPERQAGLDLPPTCRPKASQSSNLPLAALVSLQMLSMAKFFQSNDINPTHLLTKEEPGMRDNRDHRAAPPRSTPDDPLGLYPMAWGRETTSEEAAEVRFMERNAAMREDLGMLRPRAPG